MHTDQSNIERGGILFYWTALTLFSALILGGGTRAGFLGDALLQYIAFPLLILSVSAAAKSDKLAHRRALWFCAAIFAVPLLQLIPLPPAVRAVLPGYQWVADAYNVIGASRPFWPVSLTPHATWLALLSLIPPIAIFLGVMLLGKHERAKLVYLLLAVCGFSVFLGLLQLSQGPESSLRPFAFTNTLDAVGLFANRNHYSALLYCGTAFGAWYLLTSIKPVMDMRAAKGKLVDSRAIMIVVGAFVLFAIIVIAQAMARSRAGIILSIVALLMVLPMVLADRRNTASAAGTLKLVYAIAAFAVVFALQFALLRIMARFEADPLQDARIMYARTTMRAAMSYMPFGAGTGSFVSVFPQFEAQQDLLRTFANRAHNDFAEAALESGVLAVALMLVFVVWFVRKGLEVWRDPHDVSSSYLTLMRAAWVAVALLALHSFVDYPLRTSALASVAAFACALLLPARHEHRHRDSDADHEVSAEAAPESRLASQRAARPAGRHKTAPQLGSAEPFAPIEPQTPPRPYQRWDAPVEWPEEWKSKPDASVPKAPAGWDSKPRTKEPEDGGS